MEAIEQKITELQSVRRIVENLLNLLADIDIKGCDVFAVVEIVQWLQNFQRSVGDQVETLQSTIQPSQGQELKPKVIEPELVSESKPV